MGGKTNLDAHGGVCCRTMNGGFQLVLWFENLFSSSKGIEGVHCNYEYYKWKPSRFQGYSIDWTNKGLSGSFPADLRMVRLKKL
jgi:hypothetical protein